MSTLSLCNHGVRVRSSRRPDELGSGYDRSITGRKVERLPLVTLDWLQIGYNTNDQHKENEEQAKDLSATPIKEKRPFSLGIRPFY